MGIFEEGRTDCVKTLLKPAERTLKQGLDILGEDFDRRADLWRKIKDNYDRYLDGECGEFLSDLDRHFQSKFEGALAILAWSFWKNGEGFEPARRRYSEKELQAIERVLSYNVFEILSHDEVMARIMRKDADILNMLRDYYLNVQRWMDEFLNDPSVKLSLRNFLKEKWSSYRGKVDEAISDATRRFTWFTNFLLGVSEEEKALEEFYQKQMSKIRERYESLMREMEAAKEEEISRILKEKEELERQMRELEDKIENDEEKARLREELERMRSALDEKLAEIQRKEEELKKKEAEITSKEKEVQEKIREILKAQGKIEKGSRFVRRDEARIMEMNFTGRLREKLASEVKINGKTFKPGTVEERATYDTSVFSDKLEERDLKNVPENTELSVEFTEKKLLGKKGKVLVKALFYSRPKKYAELGFDVDPLELADINALLIDAKKSDADRVILLVASPTGFESRVRDYVNSQDFRRNFVSGKVSLALLDLESGELTINPHDEYAKAFEPYLRLERDEELMAKLKELIEDGILVRGYVVLDDMLKHGNEEDVKRAFHELSKEKGYITKFIEGVGFVIAREGFI
ncbi:hypothetical protein [Thermococcus sp. Bubb.Bath]|uniref:hypothetical protein n=1 Tax=Thermococcus sp. Bubb.Bath TaxID=1638242 RepID=UPI001438DF65|nr:hypothetical protein [Thermococcus sp. Bubb.Bath]NJF25674.1 hypothetical protein [Thermococcus sp. Bubb.Bath]